MLLPALALVAALASAPDGDARIDAQDGSTDGPVVLRLVSFTTERVRVPRLGAATSAELLFRSASGAKLELRFLFRGRGAVPPSGVVTMNGELAGARFDCAPTSGGSPRVTLGRASEDRLEGAILCLRPATGHPFDATFRARR
jgi:hypothetical protein